VGTRQLVTANPELDNSPVWVRLHSTNPQYDRIEMWGKLADYR
jgi:hypothetical protein